MIPQTDPSWIPSRVGKLTASRMNDAMDVTKAGKSGAARVKLLHELLAERVTGVAATHYVTPAMEHGLTYEAPAAEAWEALTGEILLPGGLVDHPTIENLAATPDRFLDHDRLVEIKCPNTSTFIGWKLAGVVPEQHRAQMAVQLLCTGRRAVEFVAFDPRLPPEQQLFTRTYEPTRAELEIVENAAIAFLTELDQMFEIFTTTV